MLIDTDKLRAAVKDFEATEAAALDKIPDDRAAIWALTRAESRSIKRDEAIEEVEQMARAFL